MKEKERGSSCPVESIQRGGAEYNSLRGGEIHWCKSNSLSHAPTQPCSYTYINTSSLSESRLFLPSPDISLCIVLQYNFCLSVSHCRAHSASTLRLYPHTQTCTIPFYLCKDFASTCIHFPPFHPYGLTLNSM